MNKPGEGRDASSRARIDGAGRAFAGSQLQIQIYVNRRVDELDKSILAALPALASGSPRITWVSPIESRSFIEYQDDDFLEALGMTDRLPALKGFWPRGGPTWDGLASLQLEHGPQRNGVLLVEGKSHVPEVYGPGCQASPESRAKISKALSVAKRWLQVPDEFDWLGPLYQSANRLAHLYFFREVLQVPAWLVNVCFLDDPHSPTSRQQWQEGLRRIKAELGLSGKMAPNYTDVLLPARTRSELVKE